MAQTFRQGCCSCILRVKSNTLRRNVNFEKVFASAHIFLDSEPKNCGFSSKKCRKFCQKSLRCTDKNKESRINFRSIIWLYLYSDFEQKKFWLPSESSRESCSNSSRRSQRNVGRKNWFLKIRVFFKRFMNFDPKDCENL